MALRLLGRPRMRRVSCSVVLALALAACAASPSAAPHPPGWPHAATDTAPATDAAALSAAARTLLSDSPRCTEIASNTSGVYSPVTIRAEIAATGEVGKIVSVDHAPDREPIAECYVEELRKHRFERAPGAAPVEVEVSLTYGTARAGKLDKDAIRKVVREHIEDVRACYEKGLAEDATAKGRVMIRFTIGAAGNVEATEVAQSDLEDPAVGSCIAAAAGTWTFPPPESGASVVVSYPFELQFDDD